MYKKQLSIQKIVCFIAVVAAVISFVYALGIMTDVSDGLRLAYSMEQEGRFKALAVLHKLDPENNPDLHPIAGAELVKTMQPFNKQYVNYAIYMILAAALLFVTNTHIRRKYYITNYLSLAIYSGVTIFSNVWMLQQVRYFENLYSQVDFEGLAIFASKYDVIYKENSFFFQVEHIVFAIGILSVVLLVLSTIWKLVMMHCEKKLIAQGKEVA